MKNLIHPTAIIDPKAVLGKNNYIGPFCYIGPNVKMGDNNRLESHISVGTAAEHRDYYHSDPGPVSIGSHCVIREFVTINGATDGTTQVGNRVVLLRGSHIGHDVVVRDKANISCNVLVGGHALISEGANLGLGAAIHQFRIVGSYSMVGMNSTVTRNIAPFVVAYGSPCEAQKLNRIGLQRSGISESELLIFENWFQNSAGQLESPRKLLHTYQNYIETYLKDCVGPEAHAHGKAA